MNIEEAKANIGAEVVLLEDTKPYHHAEGLSALDKTHPKNTSYSLFITKVTESGEVELSCVPRGEYKIYYIFPHHIALKEPKMQNYKIKVANEVESKEAQVLLFGLGYEWLNNEKEYFTLLEDHFIVTFSDGVMVQAPPCNYNTAHEEHQEITLPQLRDLAVLHRNDVSDATHDGENGNKWLVLGKGEKYDFYFWHKESNKWISNPLNTNNRPKMTPIKPQMTWQDALRAVADGKHIEVKNISWFDAEKLKLEQIKQGKGFRLTPQRKELNGNFTKEELLKIAGEMV